MATSLNRPPMLLFISWGLDGLRYKHPIRRFSWPRSFSFNHVHSLYIVSRFTSVTRSARLFSTYTATPLWASASSLCLTVRSDDRDTGHRRRGRHGAGPLRCGFALSLLDLAYGSPLGLYDPLLILRVVCELVCFILRNGRPTCLGHVGQLY